MACCSVGGVWLHPDCCGRSGPSLYPGGRWNACLEWGSRLARDTFDRGIWAGRINADGLFGGGLFCCKSIAGGSPWIGNSGYGAGGGVSWGVLSGFGFQSSLQAGNDRRLGCAVCGEFGGGRISNTRGK